MVNSDITDDHIFGGKKKKPQYASRNTNGVITGVPAVSAIGRPKSNNLLHLDGKADGTAWRSNTS